MLGKPVRLSRLKSILVSARFRFREQSMSDIATSIPGADRLASMPTSELAFTSCRSRLSNPCCACAGSLTRRSTLCFMTWVGLQRRCLHKARQSIPGRAAIWDPLLIFLWSISTSAQSQIRKARSFLSMRLHRLTLRGLTTWRHFSIMRMAPTRPRCAAYASRGREFGPWLGSLRLERCRCTCRAGRGHCTGLRFGRCLAAGARRMVRIWIT